jgi:hypothetical protein
MMPTQGKDGAQATQQDHHHDKRDADDEAGSALAWWCRGQRGEPARRWRLIAWRGVA